MEMENDNLQAGVQTWNYIERTVESEDVLSALSEESQAALRQYSLERTMGYGVDYADAVELRARVLAGETWQSAANTLAEICLARSGKVADQVSMTTQIAHFRRASALFRISQAMMIADSDERREIFSRAASLYEQAATLAGDCERVSIETGEKPLIGWLFRAQGEAVASVIVIGGVEGWAMDFDSTGHALAARGIDALLLDGPGQGETRFVHRHYLSKEWRDAYRYVLDYLENRAPELPIGFVGNSMGGSFAMAIAIEDERIRACCNNGGPIAPWMAPQGTTFFSKMTAFCGVETTEETLERWETVTPGAPGPNSSYSLLMIQGGKDPLVSIPIAQMLFDNVPMKDKQMVIFSDGDHCIYRHKQDRDILISDWLRSTLSGAQKN